MFIGQCYNLETLWVLTSIAALAWFTWLCAAVLLMTTTSLLGT